MVDPSSASDSNNYADTNNALSRSATLALAGAEDEDEPPSPRPAPTQSTEVTSGHGGHVILIPANAIVHSPVNGVHQQHETDEKGRYEYDDKPNLENHESNVSAINASERGVDENTRGHRHRRGLSLAYLRRIVPTKKSPEDLEGATVADGETEVHFVTHPPRRRRPNAKADRFRALFTPVHPIGPSPTYAKSLLNTLKYSPLNIFLPFIPISWALHYLHLSPTLIFIFSALGIIPLAALLSFGTEQIALRTSHSVGGLLNATLGNVIEMIIAGIALQRFLGMAFVVGGYRFQQQEFQPMVAQLNLSLMTVAVISLIVPAAFHEYMGDRLPQGTELGSLLRLSRGSAFVLIFIYCAYLFFQFYSHNHLFLDTIPSTPTSIRSTLGRSSMRTAASTSSLSLPLPSTTPAGVAPVALHVEQPALNKPMAVLLCVVVTVLAYLTSEKLIDSLHGVTAAHASLSQEWLTLIIIPIISNAAEHTTAVVVASKGNFNLAMSVAVGSCIQIALFVIPVLVCVAWGMGKPLTLLFDEVETVVLFFAVLMVKFSVEDGKSHWMSGVVLISVRYLVDLGINGIISLNEFPYKYSEKGLLNAFGIDYLHLPIRDYSTPTLNDMDDAYDFFLKHRSTLVHCGYGHGRTGTMITTLQLCCTDGRYPREYDWERNHVETPGQRQFLKSVVYDVGRWPKSKAVDYSDRYWKRGEDGKDEGRKGRRNDRMKK
ncbi:hypothetical protein ONZ45_g6746 [Pleurotus djamor]|nr:hypothetical protein ONZ45_g6746 [Pleurotus djamor]